MSETQFVYSLFAAVVVTWVIAVRYARWREKRRLTRWLIKRMDELEIKHEA